ncbi:hypothetical protein SK128_010636 [Halocaridina rubra]|uniref:Uncharacterized protein n=1 Tax=Halocaridina rubra TaxID=373956 RepID=A0AAN8XN12_HALRR
MFKRILLLLLLLEVISVALAKEVEPQKNFQLRECRQRAWRGDLGDLPENTFVQEHPRDVKVHSRRRRFISWPSGATLSIYTGLSLPVITINNGFNSMSMYLGFPFTLQLPDQPIVFSGKGTTTTTTTSAPSYSSYGHSNNSRNDIPLGSYNYYHQASDSIYNYPGGGYSSYSSYDPHSPYSKRSLDSQRKAGFDVIQNALENFGLPGKSCLLRAVCEVAEEPVSHLGLMGDVLNLFLAAGYGEGSDDMAEYIKAEELGRREGECGDQYSECPMPLSALLQGGLTYLHAGLANTGRQGVSFL